MKLDCNLNGKILFSNIHKVNVEKKEEEKSRFINREFEVKFFLSKSSLTH
jgi:hypothetical protein